MICGIFKLLNMKDKLCSLAFLQHMFVRKYTALLVCLC
jgi:hypothetical protein